jgi:integrase
VKQGRKNERYSVKERVDRKTWEFSLRPECGLAPDVCEAWQRKSLSTIPHEVRSRFKDPTTRTAAAHIVEALIEYLRGHEEAVPLVKRGTPVGDWMRLFLDEKTSPRAARLVGKNRPYSPQTIYEYQSLFNNHLDGDPFLELSMEHVEQKDVLALLQRIAAHRMAPQETTNPRIPKPDYPGKPGPKPKPREEKPAPPSRSMAGTRQYEKVYSFVRMMFREYQLSHPRFFDPFLSLERPRPVQVIKRGALEENEIAKLFSTPGVFLDPLERAVAAAMFWGGLRRSEIFGLLPGDLDWTTPCIHIQHAWKNFTHKNRILGDPKHHKLRIAPFPDILQKAIRDLWEQNGQHDYVFAFKDGSLPGGTWFAEHVRQWFSRAGIKIEGRKITPHSARHSLASVLESEGVPLRYIQDLLGHSDLKTTLGYLHTPQGKINEITTKINESH